jgi:hypothetical protein
MIKTDTLNYTESPLPQPLPPAGGKFTDGLSDITILRFTDERDGSAFGTTYSVWSTENCDGTRVWVHNSLQSSYWIGLVDPVTFARMGPLEAVSPPGAKLYTHLESAFWSFTDPDKIFVPVDAKFYFYRPSTRQYTLLKDFTGYFPVGYYFVQLYVSKDDNRFGVMIRNSASDQGFIVYDLATNSIKLDVRTTDMNGITMDKSGQYVYYVADTPLVSKVYSVDTGAVETLVSNPSTGQPDYQVGHNDAGTNFLAGDDQWRGAINVRQMSGPHVAQPAFTYAPYWISHHISLRADNEQWGLMSTYGEVSVSRDPAKFRRECFQVGLQGEATGKIRRLFHHRSDWAQGTSRDYWDTPRANISRDGKRVWFTSNMGGSRRDLFCALIELAPSGTTPVPAPAPTPTPTPAPAPSPTPSPDGTKAVTIIDSTGGIWTLGPEKQTLRNGVHVANGFGTMYKWMGGQVYVLGTNGWWYLFNGSTWQSISQQEPGTAPPTRVVPWPKSQGQQNSLLATQRTERFFLQRTDGNSATFERVL